MRLILLLLLFFFNSFKIYSQSNNPIKIALLMPFCAKDLNKNPNHKNAELGNACREYYQGLLIATDSLKNAGFNIEISVFDTERDTLKFKKILNNDAVMNADFIIGPVIKEGQMMMQNYKNNKNAYHLSPLFTFTKTKLNDERIISGYPDLTYYADYFINYLNEKTITGNLIVLVGKDDAGKVLSSYFKQIVKPEYFYRLKLLDITKHTDIYKIINTDKENTVFIACNDENQINAALKTIADTSMFYKFTTYGLKKIIDFKVLNTDYWINANLHVLTSCYVNYSDKNVIRFINTYRNYYETEPNEYAFMGYDQIIACLFTIKENEGNFKISNNIKPITLLTNKFLFKPKTNGFGYQNSFIHILKYTDEGLVESN